MFQIPSIVTMSIAATRIHRSLVNYATESEVHDITPSHSSERSLSLTVVNVVARTDPRASKLWNRKPIQLAAFTPNHVGRVKVAINTTCEQD